MKEIKTGELPDAPKRLLELDILRAVSILMIVFFHLPYDLGIYSNSVPIQTPFYWFATRVISLGAPFGLTLFFFLSGFAIDFNNKGIASQADIMAFFRKRAKRIYPLYWVSVVLGLVIFLTLTPLVHTDVLAIIVGASPPDLGSYNFYGTFTILFLGAQVLLYPRFISTTGIWFIGTILIFYLLYPIIAHFGKNDVVRVILVSVALFCGMLVVYFALNVVGYAQMYTFFGSFVVGIIASKANLLRSGAMKKQIAVPCAVVLLFMELAKVLPAVPKDIYGGALESGLNYAFNYATFLIWFNVEAVLVIVVACYVAVVVASYVAHNRTQALSKRGVALISFIATGSYAVFLFHEQFIRGLRLALEKVPQFSITEVTLIVVCIGLPALFIAAFYEQRNEREIVNKLISITEHLWRRWRAFLYRS
jgi:peptidoglycan/LPS O-acetylase OafA/YrhL